MDLKWNQTTDMKYSTKNGKNNIYEIDLPCLQYQESVNYEATGYASLLAKAIFQIHSFDDLFNITNLKRLCEIDNLIDQVFEDEKYDRSIYFLRNNQFQLKYSFNLPHYVKCYQEFWYTGDCTSYDAKNVNIFKNNLLKCWKNNSSCDSYVFEQITSNIFQKLPIEDGKSFYISVFMPIKIYTYASEQDPRVYEKLYAKITSFYRDNKEIKLKGIDFFMQEKTFQRFLHRDLRRIPIVLILMTLAVFAFTGSIYFTVVINFGMIVSMGAAYFLYTTLIGIQFFPFINILALVVSLSVGVDDAFLLIYQFCEYRKQYDRDKAMEKSFSHVVVAMFVTSATTAASFLSNCFSNIITLKVFGIFAGLTVMANYIFVIIALPSAILLLEKHLDSWTKNINTLLGPIKDLYFYKLPFFIYRFNIIITWMTFLSGIFAIYTISVNPGIRIAKSFSPILKNDHEYEWFNENHEDLFNFNKLNIRKQQLVVLFGLLPNEDASYYNADNIGTLQANSVFQLKTLSDFMELEKILTSISNQNLVKTVSNKQLWITNFLKWAYKQKCNRINEICCFINSSMTNYPYAECLHKSIYELEIFDLQSEYTILNSQSDGPIFTKNNKTFIGYYYQAPTIYPYSQSYKDLNILFKDILHVQAIFQRNDSYNALVLSSELTTRLYELLQNVKTRTINSILVSIFVSAIIIALTTWSSFLTLMSIFCISWSIACILATLLLLGWKIHVFETSLIILTIGLSVDYILHVAVAYKMENNFHDLNKFINAFRAIGIPIFFSAGTNILAGITLIWSQTKSFYETGVMIIVLSVISYGAAFFVFPALVFTLSKFTTVKYILLNDSDHENDREPTSRISSANNQNRIQFFNNKFGLNDFDDFIDSDSEE